MSLRLSVSQPITNRLHYSHSDFNKTTKQKIGPPADTVTVTSNGITAREPQQNPVLVFFITLTQKRVCPPVWIILVLHAELVSVSALLVKGPSLQHPIHSRTCVRCAFPVACTHTKQKSENANANSHEHISTSRARTNTHTHANTNTGTHAHDTFRVLKSMS